MATLLSKALKRAINISGADYVLTITPEGSTLTPKGKPGGTVVDVGARGRRAARPGWRQRWPHRSGMRGPKAASSSWPKCLHCFVGGRAASSQ